MTATPAALALAAPVERFPDFPPRDDMQNPRYLYRPGYLGSLAWHFGRPDTTIVYSEMPVGWTAGQQAGLLIPDLMVVFDAPWETAFAHGGYAINTYGKPPDFVLEIASPLIADSNYIRARNARARNDYIRKRAGYAAYGIPEYWRFDPTGGRFYPVGLAGDQLDEDGAYRPIPVAPLGADSYCGHSDVLNLDLCWEAGRLRWYDPAAGRYLLTHDEEIDGRLAAEAAYSVAEAGRISAVAAYNASQAALAAEREALAAEREARRAIQERLRQLEAQSRGNGTPQ